MIPIALLLALADPDSATCWIRPAHAPVRAVSRADPALHPVLRRGVRLATNRVTKRAPCLAVPGLAMTPFDRPALHYPGPVAYRVPVIAPDTSRVGAWWPWLLPIGAFGILLAGHGHDDQPATPVLPETPFVPYVPETPTTPTVPDTVVTPPLTPPDTVHVPTTPVTPPDTVTVPSVPGDSTPTTPVDSVPTLPPVVPPTQPPIGPPWTPPVNPPSGPPVTTTPEPSTLALMVGGLLLIAAAWRRAQRTRP